MHDEFLAVSDDELVPPLTTTSRDLLQQMKLSSTTKSLLLMAWFKTLNRWSHTPVTAESGAVVSLTSFGRRTASVHLTIESIARGRLRPSRLILWLDEPGQLSDLTPGIKRLIDRGLEVLPTEDFGPHKKYFPYASSQSLHTESLVTADDDVLYPSSWLLTLVETHKSSPDDVVGHRCRRIVLDGGRIGPYASWEPAAPGSRSIRNFATGVGGTLYPPAMVNRLREAGRGFEATCARADDIWLHVQAIRGGHRIRQTQKAYELVPLRGTRSGGLWIENVSGSGNDDQVRSTYDPDDLVALVNETDEAFDPVEPTRSKS